jgi:hypothetical protein
MTNRKPRGDYTLRSNRFLMSSLLLLVDSLKQTVMKKHLSNCYDKFTSLFFQGCGIDNFKGSVSHCRVA